MDGAAWRAYNKSIKTVRGIMMKRFGKKLLSLVLAAVMLCGALPAALAVDTEPPLYEQFSCASPEEFIQTYGAGRWDYDTFADRCRQHYEAILADPQIALDYYGYASLEELDQDIAEWQAWGNREEFYRNTAVSLTWDDEWAFVPPLSVQLDGETVDFPDAQPEAVSGRTMVPFRAIAEALGAQVSYADGSVTAEKDGIRYAFALGIDRMRVSDAKAGTSTEVQMDAAPYQKNGRTYVPVRFFAEAFGLTVRWDAREQTAVLYDRDALIAELDERFTVVNEWLAAQPVYDGEQALYTAAAIRVLYTALNSIDGDEQYTLLDGTVEVVSQGQSMEMDIQLDIYALVQMIAEQSGRIVGEELAQQVEQIQEQLENVRFEMIYDADADTLYLRCPLLFDLLTAAALDGAGADVAPETWFRVENLMENALGLTGEEVSDGLAAMSSGLTVGGLLLAQTEQNCEVWGNYSELWYNAHWDADQMAGYAADDKFTQSGARYTAVLENSSEDTEWGQSYYIKGAYTLDTQSGAVTGAFEIRDTTSYSDTLATYSFELTAASGQIAISVHEKNQSITQIMIDITQEASDTAPAAQPPEGDPVIDLVDWYEGLWPAEQPA